MTSPFEGGECLLTLVHLVVDGLVEVLAHCSDFENYREVVSEPFALVRVIES